MKHRGFFLKQEKGHIREVSRASFTSSRGKRISIEREANDVLRGVQIMEHKLEEVENSVMLSRDEMVTIC